jgi:hypothetical protein
LLPDRPSLANLLWRPTAGVKLLPAEYGLIVSWFFMIVGAVLLSSGFNSYGFGLIIVLVPTLFVYDRVIVGLRFWSLGKVDLRVMLVEKVGAPAQVILSVAVVYVAAGLLLNLMPWIPVLVAAFILVSEGVAFRYLKERHMVTRAVSILAVDSQFLLVNSALSGTVTSFEMIAFTMISLVGVLLVANVVRQAENSRIPVTLSRRGSIGEDLPFFVAGIAIATAISLTVSEFYLWFVLLLVAIEWVYRYGLRGRTMRTRGILSSYAEAAALLLLFLHLYGVL